MTAATATEHNALVCSVLCDKKDYSAFTHSLRGFKHLLKSYNSRMMHFLQCNRKVAAKLDKTPKKHGHRSPTRWCGNPQSKCSLFPNSPSFTSIPFFPNLSLCILLYSPLFFSLYITSKLFRVA